MKRHLQVVREPKDIAGVPPPNDLDAEAAVISACLLKEDVFPAVDAILGKLRRPFFSDANGIIYRAIQQLGRSGGAIDTVTVASLLKQQDADDGGTRYAAAGGAAYLAQLVDATPAIGHARDHAVTVAELAKRRTVIAELQHRTADLYRATPDVAKAALDDLQAAIVEAQQDDSEPTTGMLGPALDEAVRDVVALQTGRAGGVAGVSTGIDALDKLTGGMFGGDLTFLGGPPKRGKTSFASGLALAVCKQGEYQMDGDRKIWVPYGTAIFTLEMNRQAYALRMACSWGRVNLHAVRIGEATAADFGRLYEARDELESMPVYFDDATDLSPAKLRPRVRAARAALAKRGAKLKLVIVDYLGLMEASVERERESEQERTDLKGRELRKLSQGDLETHYLVLSQLNEDGDLRGSRALDGHAVNVWKIQADKEARDSARWGHDEAVKPARLHIARQRNGPWPRDVPLWFHENFARFSDESLL